MPRIAEIDGIVISVNFEDHAPPHFHARYQRESISVEIETGNVIGSMSAKNLRKVELWPGISPRLFAGQMARVRRCTVIKPLEITKAEYLEGYRLLIWFNDGALKVVDLAGYLYKPHLAPLRKEGQIRRFQLDLGTIIWDNEIDIAPEFLYNIAVNTLRPGDRSQWEWGEPYSAEMLQPKTEDLTPV